MQNLTNYQPNIFTSKGQTQTAAPDLTTLHQHPQQVVVQRDGEPTPGVTG